MSQSFYPSCQAVQRSMVFADPFTAKVVVDQIGCGDTLSATMPTTRHLKTVVAALLVLGCAACGQPEPTEEAVAEPAAEPMAPMPSMPEPSGPRAIFVAPEDGATVQSLVRLEFGTEDFQIAAVPAGPVTDPRPAMGHHHVAIDTECLPAGTPIPRAAPWVHFGDGSNVIDMQLPAGPHTLTLQIGDDLHQTIEGLCTTISVNVVE